MKALEFYTPNEFLVDPTLMVRADMHGFFELQRTIMEINHPVFLRFQGLTRAQLAEYTDTPIRIDNKPYGLTEAFEIHKQKGQVVLVNTDGEQCLLGDYYRFARKQKTQSRDLYCVVPRPDDAQPQRSARTSLPKETTETVQSGGPKALNRYFCDINAAGLTQEEFTILGILSGVDPSRALLMALAYAQGDDRESVPQLVRRFSITRELLQSVKAYARKDIENHLDRYQLSQERIHEYLRRARASMPEFSLDAIPLRIQSKAKSAEREDALRRLFHLPEDKRNRMLSYLKPKWRTLLLSRYAIDCYGNVYAAATYEEIGNNNLMDWHNVDATIRTAIKKIVHVFENDPVFSTDKDE